MKELISYSIDLRTPLALEFQFLNINDLVVEHMLKRKEFRDPLGSGLVVLSPHLLIKPLSEGTNVDKGVCIQGFGYASKSADNQICKNLHDEFTHYGRFIHYFSSEEEKCSFSVALQNLIAGMLKDMEHGTSPRYSPRMVIYYG